MIHAFLAATPFLVLAVMLWTAWRVLEVFRGVLIPARIREVVLSADGSLAHLLLDTREPDGTQGEAWVHMPAQPLCAPGRKVTLWRGEGLSLARWGHATLSVCVMGGVAVAWVLLYVAMTTWR